MSNMDLTLIQPVITCFRQFRGIKTVDKGLHGVSPSLKSSHGIFGLTSPASSVSRALESIETLIRMLAFF